MNGGDPHYPEDDEQLGRLEPGFLIGGGRYTLKKIVGVGPVSVVWLATDRQLEEEVALKLFRTEVASDSAFMTTLRRETQQSRKLGHPNLARIYDFFHAPGEPAFIAMEHVQGTSLRDLQLDQADQIFEWEYLSGLAAQLCAALDYAHSEGFMHGNLKPSNLILDAHGRLKITDFGLPVAPPALMRQITGADFAESTLSYLSPQRLDGKPLTAADDIYALGACLYQFLAGKPPFWTGDIAHQVRHGRPEPLADAAAEASGHNQVPSHLAALVMACLAKEPGHRPESVAAVRQWIETTPESAPDAANAHPNVAPPVPTGAKPGEPISLIPPEDAEPEPISLIPPEAPAGHSPADPWQEEAPPPEPEPDPVPLGQVLARHRISLAVVLGLCLLAAGYYWGIRNQEIAVAEQARRNFQEVQQEIERDLALRDRLQDSRIIQVGAGPAFAYHYRPRESRGLDTNALNENVRFWYEGPARANCSFIAPMGTNDSRGIITYQFEPLPGYRISDLTLSQSSAIYTRGSVTGEISTDGGETFRTFYSTPPFQRGGNAGHAATANLSALDATNVLIRYTLYRFDGHDYNIQFLRDADDAPAALEIRGRVLPEAPAP